MKDGYKLVRYIGSGFTAERKTVIAERLLKKGRVEIISQPKSRVLQSPGDKKKKPGPEEKKPDNKQE